MPSSPQTPVRPDSAGRRFPRCRTRPGAAARLAPRRSRSRSNRRRGPRVDPSRLAPSRTGARSAQALASRQAAGRSRRRCVRCRRYWTGRAPRSSCIHPRQNPGSDSGWRRACGCRHGRGGRAHRPNSRKRVRARRRPRPRRRSPCRASEVQAACMHPPHPIARAQGVARHVRSKCDAGSSSVRILQDHRRAFFRDHRRRRIGIARRNRRHHRSVGHAQAHRYRENASARRRRPADRSPFPSSRSPRDGRSWCRCRRRLLPATRRHRRRWGRADIPADDIARAASASSAAVWCGWHPLRPGGRHRSTDSSARSRAPRRVWRSGCARCRARSAADCRR